jgi:hypothetical protein
LRYYKVMDRLVLRKIGGSLYFRLPFKYRHKFGLQVGDQYDLIPNGDGTLFKLIKVDEAEEVTTEEEAAVDAA